MQQVKHSPYLHSIFDDIDKVYSLTSKDNTNDARLFATSICLDESFRDLIALFSSYSDLKLPNIKYIHKEYEPLNLPEYDPKNVIVCYSGGKDSYVASDKLRQAGNNVYLFHVTGLNYAYVGYASELDMATQSALLCGTSLYTDHISYVGTHRWVEHPMKNMLLWNLAINLGIRERIGVRVATGNFINSTLEYDPFEICGGDCKEMLDAYTKIIRRVIPNFVIETPNVNVSDSYEYLLHKPEMLGYTISCMTSNRYRKQFRERTQAKYHIPLLPKRCGCCWKCASEYIYFADHNILEYNEAYYIHCLEILNIDYKRSVGVIPLEIDALWEHYFTYSILQSKAKEQLINAFIYSNGKIKYTH